MSKFAEIELTEEMVDFLENQINENEKLELPKTGDFRKDWWYVQSIFLFCWDDVEKLFVTIVNEDRLLRDVKNLGRNIITREPLRPIYRELVMKPEITGGRDERLGGYDMIHATHGWPCGSISLWERPLEM